MLLHLQHLVVLSSPFYLEDFWKIFLDWYRNSCCLEIALFCCRIVWLWWLLLLFCFSSSIPNIKPFLLSPCFWSHLLVFSFFHISANNASIVLRSFLNLLVSLKIILFQNGSFFFFAFDFFMPTSSPTILIAAYMTFP